MKLDTQSILFFLAISNIFIALIFSSFIFINKGRKQSLILFVIGKLFQAGALICFGIINTPPYISNLAVFLLIYGYSAEIYNIISFDKSLSKRSRNSFIIITTILAFAGLGYYNAEEYQLGIITSISSTYIFAVAGISLTLKKHKVRFTKIIGFAYLTFILFWISYAVQMFILGDTFVFLSNENTFHTNLSLAANLIIMLGSIGFLLILKEQDEQRIKQDNYKLKELITDKEKLYRIIAHDLRSPLGSLVQLIEFLCNNQDEIEPFKRKQYLDSMKDTSKDIFNLLDNLLHWSRIEKVGLKVNKTALDIRTVADNNIKLFKEVIKLKNISVKNTIHYNSTAWADENMIDTVIRNLLSNALKYTPEGGNIIFSSQNTSDNMIKIDIKDTGTGINKNTLSNIFEKKYIHSTPGTNNEKGTGLGLKICKEFVDKNDGEISVITKKEYGTSFIVSLPINTIKKFITQNKAKPIFGFTLIPNFSF